MKNRNRKRLAALLLAAALGCLGIGMVSVHASDAEMEVDFSDNIMVEDLEDFNAEVTPEVPEVIVEQEDENNENGNEEEVVPEEEPSENSNIFEDGEANSETEAWTEEATKSCGIEENTVFWSLNEDGVLTITGQGAMQTWETEEKVPWNSMRQEIKKIEIADGVTSIGAYAFSNCINITETEMPESVQEIGEYAFFNCSGLATLTIG